MRGHVDKVSRQAKEVGRAAPPSTTIVLSTEGLVWTTQSVSTALPSSDMIIFQLSDTPVRSPASQNISPTGRVPRLTSLPVNPYPTPVGSPVSVFSFRNPVQWAASTTTGPAGRSLPKHAWTQGTVTEYRDPIGKEAKVRPD